MAKAETNVKKSGKGVKFDFLKMLLLFAIVPMLVSVVVITAMFINSAKKEINSVMSNYLYSMAVSEGQGLEDEMTLRGNFALQVEDLTEYCSDITIEGLPSSYCYVVAKDGTMLWHPTSEKIGEPVTNEVIKAVCEDMQNGIRDDAQCVSYVFNGEQKYAAYYVHEKYKFVLVISADQSEVMANINKIANVGTIVAVLLIIVFGILAVIISKKITKPLTKVVDALKNTSDGNLNADTDIKSSIYETQQLVESAKTLQSVLQNTIGQTQSISNELKVGAESVTELAEHSKEGSDQISQAIEDLAQGASSMADNVQSINGQVIDMGNSIEGISDNTRTLVDLSNNIKSANDDAAMYIGKVSDSSEKSVSAVSAISEQIKATNDSVDKIKNAAEMIGSIANQTNLLALNASIEAARAGEAGRGFAVVAEEIKNLSEQSNASADEIRKVVNEVITQSSKSVTLAAQVTEIISEEQGFIEETGKKFDVLQSEIDQSLIEINNISSKVEDLNQAKLSITESVSDLSAISEQNAASNQEVSASVAEIAASISSIADNSGTTNEMAETLTETVSYFK